MKRVFAFFLTLLVAAQAGFCREYTRDQLETKKQKFGRMKTTGFTLGGIGAAMLVGGAVLAANGEWETYNTPSGSSTEPQDAAAGTGFALLVIGIPMTVGGIILGSIGSRKVTQYQDMLDNMAVGFDIRDGRKGLRLSYAF